MERYLQIYRVGRGNGERGGRQAEVFMPRDPPCPSEFRELTPESPRCWSEGRLRSRERGSQQQGLSRMIRVGNWTSKTEERRLFGKNIRFRNVWGGRD